jgi:predicted nucleic acid-binding protein
VTLVIDASVALKWVLDEPGSDAADALLDETLIAPGLWLVEVANALWRRRRQGELTQDEARRRLSALMDAPVSTTPIEDDLLAAAELAASLDHPVYDCLYLALAIREDAVMVTADPRFATAAGRRPEFARRVRVLGDPPGAAP